MSEDQVQSFKDQATSSIQSGDFARGLEFVEQAEALAPNDSEIAVLKGICYSQTGRPADATTAFRKAIMLSPYNAKAYFNLAVHLYGQGEKAEALAMAEEAAKIDVRHTGARQLIDTIKSESDPKPAAVAYNPADPLSGPTPTETSERPSMPSAPSSPYGGSQAPYMRPDYSSGPEHSIDFVAKLGGGWVAIGWVMAGLSLLSMVLTVGMMGPIFNAAVAGNQAEIERLSQTMGGNPVLSILGWTALLGGILWMILDLVDRRGNFVWIIPQVLCSCCGLGFITLPIYIAAGRK